VRVSFEFGLLTFAETRPQGATVDAGEIFSALALFTLIQNYLRMMPRAMASYNQLFISQKRIKQYMQQKEREDPEKTGERSLTPGLDGFGAIKIEK